MERDYYSEERLKICLSDCDFFCDGLCFDKVTSTNDIAKSLAENGTAEGTIVLAAEQTAGRGRMGRTFYSPKRDGLYISLILRPQTAVKDAGLITACAAVAARRSVLELTGVPVDIKWVNDLLFCEKKLCGILAEGQFSSQGELAFMILGLGINLRRPASGYAAEIDGKTVSLQEIASDTEFDSTAVASSFVKAFGNLYKNLPDISFLKEYKEASCILHKEISFFRNGEQCFGRAIDIDEQARLEVVTKEGTHLFLASGEVSLIRPVKVL